MNQLALESAAQIGGAYIQVVAVGSWLIASRIGGLQVLTDSGALNCVSECALIEIPLLEVEGDKLYAVFRRRTFLVSIDLMGQLVFSQSERREYKPPRGHDCRVDISRGKILLDREEGAVVTPFGTVKLPGYSRPSGICVSSDGGRIYVADMGVIHRLKLQGDSYILTGSMENPGWPKDVACAGGDVFVANVLGVAWYRELADYPFIELKDRLCRFHFRIAKVTVRNSIVYACDEARGVHAFAMVEGKLKPLGGVFVPGGGWDCAFDGEAGYVASGSGGWRYYENLEDAVRGRKVNVRHYASVGGERVQGVAPWPDAKAVVAMSDRRVRIVSKQDGHELFTADCNAWSGVSLGDLFVVATTKGLMTLCLKGVSVVVLGVERTEEARDVSWDGFHLWVADGKGGVRCYQRADAKVGLAYVGCFPVCGFSRGLCRTESRVYVGAGDGGLSVISSEGGRKL